jgi:hypothetical protein
MPDIDLSYQGAIWMLDILSSTDPDMQPGCEMFNFFFSQMMFFALIGLLIKWIVRALSRS